MSERKGGRQRYRCTGCGVVVEGRATPDGRVMAYDRAGYDGSPVRPARCMSCAPCATTEAPPNA